MWPFVSRKRAGVEGLPSRRLTFPSLWKPKGDHTMEGSEAIFGAVTLLSNTFASTRVELMQGYHPAKDHPLQLLMGYQPNVRMDAYTFRQTLEACRNTSGNCYALKVWDSNGSIAALDILNPDRVEPLRDRDTGEVWYRITPEEGGEMYVSWRDMLHCRHACTGGDKGVSPTDVLRDTLDYDDRMKEFSLEQVKGINGAVVLDFPSDLNPGRVKEIIDTFMEHYRRSSNSILVLSGGVKSSTINRSPVDAKVLDVDRITANKVARVFNIPPSLLGDYSTSSYSSQEQQQLEFVQRTMLPIFRMYEAQWNLKLLTPKEIAAGYHFAFRMEDLTVADTRTRAEAVQYQIRNGQATPNELRQREGREPLPGGDQLLVSRDLVSLQWLEQHPQGGIPAGKGGNE